MRLLQPRDNKEVDVDVRVEEGDLLLKGRAVNRKTAPFSISAQQRSEYEEQIKMFLKGRV
jgi:hypothetical protein